MDKQSAIDLMKDRSFSFYGIVNNSIVKNSTMYETGYRFASCPIYKDTTKMIVEVPSFDCIVYPESECFLFHWSVPGTHINVDSDTHAFLTDDAEFFNALHEHQKTVRAIQWVFG